VVAKDNRTATGRGQRRAAILSVANEVFAEEGYSSASMSNIASRLGGSKGTLYNYFRSKEELFHAHVEDRCACQVRTAFAQPFVGDDPTSVLAELGDRILTILMSDESVTFYSLIVSEARRDPSIGQAFYDNGPLLGRRRVAAFLETVRAEGLIAAEDCMEAAEDFMSLLFGGLHWKRILNIGSHPTTTEIQAEARRAAEVFMRAYGPIGHPGD
jgi:AcrR family transcriptional regulator